MMTTQKLLPRALKKGDTIGFFSPSSPATSFAPTRFARAKTYLRQHGFRLQEGALTGRTDFYRSGGIQERAEELNQLLRNPEVRCVMSTIGGMNSNSLLPYLDYDALRSDPKPIIGYSDVTALLLGIFAQTGLTTFYGPALVASFGEYPPLVDETFSSFRQILYEPPSLPYAYPIPARWTDEYINWEEQNRAKTTKTNAWVTVIPGRVEGRLIGGNLNTMLGIWGSPYMPEIHEGDILLLEDSLKDAATVERIFAHLKLNGVFDRAGGILLGKHEKFDDRGSGRQPYEILLEVLAGQQLPILADVDCCHTHPMLTLPLGIQARLDATEQRLELREPWIQSI